MSRSGGAAATLRYDPLGRLYEVTGPAGTRRFLYDGDALVAEYDAAGTLLRRYVHGGGPGDDPLVWFEGSGVTSAERRNLYPDERGSIVAVTAIDGSVINVNTYDEYGIPGANNAGAFQYTGQVWLPELGMYHYKARMYSPTLGRFMQTDPIGYSDGMNMYAYTGNDPVNAADPSGMSWVQICGDFINDSGTQSYRDGWQWNEHSSFQDFLQNCGWTWDFCSLPSPVQPGPDGGNGGSSGSGGGSPATPAETPQMRERRRGQHTAIENCIEGVQHTRPQAESPAQSV